MTEGSGRSPVMDSLKAQAQGITAEDARRAQFVDLLARYARKSGAKTFTVGLGSDGSMTCDYDFEGHTDMLRGCG